MKNDPVWLSLVFGPLAWMAATAPFVTWNDTASICLWIGVNFCLNLGVVSVGVPWLQGR